MSISESEQFFFSIRKELLKYIQDSFLSKFSDSKVQERFYELIYYTTDGGKCLRGLLTAYGYLETIGADLSSKEAKPGYALGWAQEILRALFHVANPHFLAISLHFHILVLDDEDIFLKNYPF